MVTSEKLPKKKKIKRICSLGATMSAFVPRSFRQDRHNCSKMEMVNETRTIHNEIKFRKIYFFLYFLI